MTLLEQIIKQNPHWQNKSIEEIKFYKERFLLTEIKKYIDSPQIIATLGIRRTGKTVLLLQLITSLIKKNNPKKILYFSFDEILGKDPQIIENVLNIYENEILKDELKNIFIFFDEINYLPNWQIVLKRYYDLRQNIKFFVSGSSSIYIKKTKESLAGRIYEHLLPPLSFKEYLYLKDIKIENLALQSLKLTKELNKYFICGSFPEIINENDFLKIKKYLTSLIDKIIFHDIPKVYNVAEPEVLKMILSLISQKPGMILEYVKLASMFRVSYQTISKYINYLEKSFLTKLIYNWRGSPVARAKKLKKAYLGAANLSSIFFNNEEEVLKNLPFLAENIVCLNSHLAWFYRKYNEIDFFIPPEKIAIEVKYTDKKPDIKNNLLACKELKTKNLVVVTKNFESKETWQNIKIKYIPLWKWLLTR